MAKTVLSHIDDPVQEDILRVALRLYKKYGPGKVTMDDVANGSGRSRTSLYYYYKNRDEIFQAVLEKIAYDIAAEIRGAVAQADGLDNKLYTFCRTKLKTSDEWKQILNAMWLSMNADEKSKQGQIMGTLHKKLMYHESTVINEIIADAIANGHIRRITPAELDTVAFIISSGLRGIRNEIYDHNDPHDIKTSIRLIADMVVKWLKG